MANKKIHTNRKIQKIITVMNSQGNAFTFDQGDINFCDRDGTGEITQGNEMIGLFPRFIQVIVNFKVIEAD